MYIAFFVILIDLIGFGIMVPIFAFYSLELGASPAMATVLMSLYSIAMFITTPILGRVSDFYGRRPVLMLSMLGGTIGYIILANASSLWMIAIARLISGAMSGNLAAAQAYMTDISSEKNRAKAMGLVGAAIGLGFMLGPIIGAFLAGDNFDNANYALPAYVSAALSFTAFLAIVFALPESLDKKHRDELKAKPKQNRFKEIADVMRRPLVRNIIFCNILYNLAAGLFEAVFPIWASFEGVDIIDGAQDLVPYLLAGGLSLVIVQGTMVGPLSRRFGEHILLRAGAILYGLSLVTMSFAGELQQIWLTYMAMSLASAAGALVLTSVQTLVSQTASATERGIVMGVFNSMGTLGRSIGTLSTGAAFTYIYLHAPYYICAVLMLMLIVVGLIVQRNWRVFKSSASL